MGRAVNVSFLLAAGLLAAGGWMWGAMKRTPAMLETAETPLAGPPVAVDESGRLAEQLEKNPAKPSQKKERCGLFLMDIDRGSATPIADEPAPGLTHCGSARWSRDGRRILFDATPGSQWNQTHVFAIDPGEGRPKLTDLGPGNCPSPSPDGKQVAFLLNGGAVPGAGSGIWVMNADGSGRRPLGSSGRPFWSPDGHQILIVSFSEPCQLTLMDVGTAKTRPVQVEGVEIHSVPSWADESTIIAAIGPGDGRAIALIDLADPERARVKEILREEDGKPTVTPTYPVYAATSRRSFFVNANPKGMSLYSIPPGKLSRPQRLERDGFDKHITDIAASPDGRYLVFCSDRTAPGPP